MTKRSVAILGQAGTEKLAPFEDLSWEIWALGWVFSLPRVDLRFDIHHVHFKSDPKYKGHINSVTWEPEYPKWIKDHKLPIMCDESMVERFGGTRYPLEEVRAHFPGRDVLECSVSYMIAYAIWKGYERIGLWGCHFCGNVEYYYQLPSVTYLLGWAEAKGIEVYLCPGGPLMASGYEAGRYGVDQKKRTREQLDQLPRIDEGWVEKEIGGKSVRFATYDQTSRNRVNTLRSKEPETIRWIEAMPEGSVLWDIGASIGIYSAYAAALGHKVVAVEPDKQCCHSFRSTLAASKLKATILNDKAFGMDQLDLPAPTHIKIDTDGDDLEVVRGALKAIAGAQSVIVETDERKPEDKMEIDRLLTEAGLTFTGRHTSPMVTSTIVGMDHWHRLTKEQ